MSFPSSAAMFFFFFFFCERVQLCLMAGKIHERYFHKTVSTQLMNLWHEVCAIADSITLVTTMMLSSGVSTPRACTL
jgi:hypothetical protein